ncbi:hypothetical protein M2150_002508 [Lachnospiraceae bacterium PM6-15]|uniref:hypothetical protein n=1 Tax=Ohessyouella blattaphilus TaxID=2949333 RepID=UPI003E20434C
MKEEGQFRFTNGIAIDADLESERVKAVINHEYTHQKLYSMTTYGQMVLMLEKNSMFHNKSKEFQMVLFDYLNRMQERTAVNIEIMNECIVNGTGRYKVAIEKLQNRNRKYYNYFRKLCCINGKVDSKDDAEELVQIVEGLATVALNVNPELIPLEKVNDARTLKKYFDNPTNGSLISPNKRFDILVNTIFRENDNNCDIESVLNGSIELEKMDDYDYIHRLAFQTVSKMLNDSPLKQRYVKRIDTVGGRYILNVKGGKYLTTKPAKINANKKVYLKVVRNEGDLIVQLEKQEHRELFVMHRLGGFEEIHTVCVYGKEAGKNIIYFLGLTKEDQFYNIISNTSCKFIFYKTKIMQNEAKSIRKMVRELPIYIFEDGPIIGAITFIKNFFKNGQFGFIENDKHYIFVVRKRSIILYADIVLDAKDILINELCEDNLNYIKEINEICNVKEVLRLDRTCNEYEINSKEDIKLVK